MDPHETYTVQDLIASGINDIVTYNNFSILENIGNGLLVPTQNIIYDFLDELNMVAMTVKLNDTEFNKYAYKPKLLSFDVYGTTESYFIIMALNNIIDVKDFNVKKVKMLKIDMMNELIGSIYNSQKRSINYNREKLGM